MPAPERRAAASDAALPLSALAPRAATPRWAWIVGPCILLLALRLTLVRALAWAPSPGALAWPAEDGVAATTAAIGAGTAIDCALWMILVALAIPTAGRGQALATRALAAALWAAWPLALTHALLVRCHVHAGTWTLLHPAGWRAGLEAGAMWPLAMVIAAAWWGARALGQAWPRRSPPAMRRRRRATVAGAVVAGAVVIAGYGAWRPHARHAAAVPLLDLGHAAGDWLRARWSRPAPVGADEPADMLPAATRARLVRAGVVAPPRSQGGAELPLALTAWRPDVEAVVVVLLESMHRGLADDGAAPTSEAAARTPSLRALAALGTALDGVFAAARPTHAALAAWLCAVDAGTLPLDAGLVEGAAADLPAWRRCLPRRAALARWHSTLVHGAPSRFAGVDRLAAAIGFDVALGAEALAPTLPAGAPRAPWGLLDRFTYQAALRTLDADRAAGRRSLVVIATGDGHWPGAVDPACGVAAPPHIPAAAAHWDRALRCADHALGVFIAALQQRGLGTSLALVVSADHAAPDTPALRALGPPATAGLFAALPVVVVGPGVPAGVRQAVRGTQHQAPASLAIAMGLQVSATDRLRAWRVATGPSARGGPLLIGTEAGVLIGLRQGDAHWQGPRGVLVAACGRGEPHPLAARAGLGPCDVTEWLAATDAFAWQALTAEGPPRRLAGDGIAPEGRVRQR